MSLLGNTFEEKYTNFFKFFNAKHTISEIKDFISKNKISSHSNKSYNSIHLNMIDNQNLNILFHIIIRSDSDLDCLSKLKYLIEEYNLNYNVFDYIHHRKLPFYTCVKGFLESTKYLLDKMDFDISYTESDGKTLFFSAIKSYNVELMEYLDNKYPQSIFFTDNENNTCIFNIFKKDTKNMKNKEEIEKAKNIIRYILKRGFKIDEKNWQGITFREKCTYNKIDNILNDVIKEFGGEIKNKEIKKDTVNNKINLSEKNLFNDKKEELRYTLENPGKKNNVNDNNTKTNTNNHINNNDDIDTNEKNDKNNFKYPNRIKSKLINNENKIEKANSELKVRKNSFDFDIEMDDEFIASETRKELSSNKLNIKEKEKLKSDFKKKQNCETKRKVCAFLSKKRHNLILEEEILLQLRNNENFKKYFLIKN